MTAIFVGLSPLIPAMMGAEAAIRKDAAIYFGIVCAPLMFRALLIVLGGVLRGAGDTRTPMLINAALNVLNVILNFLFIYPARDAVLFGHPFHVWGANLGVTGAAIATALSYVFGGAVMLIVLLRHTSISPRGERFRLDRAILKPCIRIAVPAVLQRLATCLGQVTFQSMVNSLGTIAATAHATAITAESAFYIPGFGMQAAASALVGQAYGARDEIRMKKLARTFLLVIVLVMSVTGALLFLLARPAMGLFTQNGEVISLGASVLMMVAVSEPVYGVAIILEGVFYGVGDTKGPFVFEVACMWGVRILGTILTVKLMGFGLRAAWTCMIAHNVILAVLMAIRYRRGRWNPLRAV
jgi:putative MATE family efflux protein